MGMPAPALYWVNMISAALDNATLAAIEINPSVQGGKLVAVMLSLLVSGGMLVPGNIPNIIAAKHLGIGSREWARYGVPLGLGLLSAYFLVWLVMF
jgi:predicted cation transporter